GHAEGANDSVARRLAAASAEGSLPVSDRLRFVLLVLVLAVSACALGRAADAARAPSARQAREEARVVRFARRLLGVRYVYGGTSPRTGFDCSGFTRFVYAHFGIDLPHFSGAQFDLGHRVSRAGLRPGDLVFFDGLGHVGIYIGHDRFIHAPHTGTDVEIDSLSG